MRTLKTVILSVALALGMSAGAAMASGGGHELPAQKWPHAGPLGKFDQAAARRGLQVYREICASCHGLKYIAFRNLAGIGLTEDQIKDVAAAYQVQDGPNDNGEMFMRSGISADRFPSPFPNEKAARVANNGAYPPDLSLMVDARVGGEDYVYALLTGYVDPPADVALMDGMAYNAYFPGNQIGMPPILSEGAIVYEDGTPATVEQMAKDVSTFLAFTSEPNQDERKGLGLKVILFLVVFSGLMFASKRELWKSVKH